MEKFFVYIRPKNGEFISPFLLSKHLDTTIGRIQSANHTKDGLLVQITKKQADKVDGSKAGTVELQVTYNEFLNTSKGLIFFPEFKYITDEEILAELEEQNVSQITRFLKKGDQMTNEKGTTEGKTNTGLFLLQFNKPLKPETIVICHERVKVRVYYPNPMRCIKCHKFGHKEKNCRAKMKICGHCAEVQQDKHDCSEKPPKCVNCDGVHPSWNWTCPLYMQEQAIIKYATNNQESYKEARQRQQTNVRISSFAETLKRDNARDEEIENLKKQMTILQETNQKLLKIIEGLNQSTLKSSTNTIIHPTTTIKDKNTKPHQPAQDILIGIKKSFEEQGNEDQDMMDIFETNNDDITPQLRVRSPSSPKKSESKKQKRENR